jgi:SH3-like domain-containing protein
MRRLLVSLIPLLFAVFAAPAAPQDREVPYWATLRSDEVNMRVGPSESFRSIGSIKRKGLPVKVVRLMQGWRLVVDPDGTQGWINARLLSPERTALVVGEGLAAMRAEPSTRPRRFAGMPSRAWSGRWAIARAAGASSMPAAAKGWIEAARIWGDGDP